MSNYILKIRSFIITGFIISVLGCSNNKKPDAESSNTATNKESTPVSKNKRIVFFGNSLTAGYGLTPDQAFPALIQKKIDSLNLPYQVINAGVSGETSSGGKTRVKWILQQPVDIFVLELGGNDGLRGVELPVIRKNLQDIIDSVKIKYPQAKLLLAGMQIPPNLGINYSNGFRELFAELAQKNSIAVVPFLLEGVGGEAALNLQDGIHPTADGHRIVAENVWTELQKLL